MLRRKQTPATALPGPAPGPAPSLTASDAAAPTQPATASLAKLTAPRGVVEKELRQQIASGEHELQWPDRLSRDNAWHIYEGWETYNRDFLRRRFSTGEFLDEYSIITRTWHFDKTLRYDSCREPYELKVRALRSLLQRLPLVDETQADIVGSREATAISSTQSLFIVHGRNNEIKQEVARFLSLVTSLDVQILHEQASRGETIIEKFERHAIQAAFAVVLLTGDDQGGVAGGSEWTPRARQNVVFELGFFFGSHGRDRVVVWYEEGVELPSDIDGLVYVALDKAGAWKLQVAKEMRAAGIDADLNRAR